MSRHPQHDNMIIAANDKDALFDCEEANWHNVTIKIVTAHPEWNWKHVKPAYKYQHVKDAWEKDKSLVIQFKTCDSDYWSDLYQLNPSWVEGNQYRIKPPYKYQHVKDAYEADKSLVVQVRDDRYRPNWIVTNNPDWDVDLEYRIKPKIITKRLYADNLGYVLFVSKPYEDYIIPINGTDTEVEIE